MSNSITMPTRSMSLSPISLYRRVLELAELVPFWLPQLMARLAIAKVFWNSSQSKLASWQVTEQLFAMEYKVPLLPPDVAALLATATELAGAVLIFLGLFTRVASLALLGVVLVIQIFVFPQSWGEHLLWASILVLLVARGAGAISLDHLAARFFARR